jgi:hypothetical protein
LASNVTEESVRGPAANEHDGENGDSGEVHGHGSAGSEGVSTDVFGGETQDILAEASSSRAKLCGDKSASDELALVMRDDSAYWAVGVTSRVAEDALNDSRPLSDGTQDRKAGRVLMDGLGPNVRFLKFSDSGSCK